MLVDNFRVESEHVKYTDDEISSVYPYQTTEVLHQEKDGKYEWVVKPKVVEYEFKTARKVPKIGYGPFPFLCSILA
jgi:myo-inositol-1-phosphate synthase